MTRSTILLAAILLGACGARSTPEPETANEAATASSEWSRSMLRKLDPILRDQVFDGDVDRVAIKVYFRGSPSDEDLATLLLSRVGRQVIGRVELATLHSIAARDDVDRIEALNDTGY